MASKFDVLPTEEDLVGSGMTFAEASAFLDRVEAKAWPVERAWAYLLKRKTDGFPKLGIGDLSTHLKGIYGDVTPADMGRP